MTGYEDWSSDNALFAKLLFLSFNLPKAIQTLTMLILIMVNLQNSYEAHFDSFELKKKNPLSKFFYIKKKLQIFFLNHLYGL